MSAKTSEFIAAVNEEVVTNLGGLFTKQQINNFLLSFYEAVIGTGGDYGDLKNVMRFVANSKSDFHTVSPKSPRKSMQISLSNSGNNLGAISDGEDILSREFPKLSQCVEKQRSSAERGGFTSRFRPGKSPNQKLVAALEEIMTKREIDFSNVKESEEQRAR